MSGDAENTNGEKKEAEATAKPAVKPAPASNADPNRPANFIEIDDSEHSLQVEFEDDDFDHEFDDDFEEEIKGEYDLEDDHYGDEFKKEFGHLTPPDDDDDKNEKTEKNKKK